MPQSNHTQMHELLNRTNYTDVHAFMKHEEDLHRSPHTLKRHWTYLKQVLEWAGPQPLSDAPTLRPTLPRYLEQIGKDGHIRADGKAGPLGVATISHTCQLTRTLLQWAVIEYPQRYNARIITPNWLATLQPTRKPASLRTREVYTCEEVEQLVNLPSEETLTARRSRAAAAFLFLSAMRVDAFVTMPIRALNLTVTPATVTQDPAWGMRTKNRKAAITYLLEIPGLLDVVREWDTLVRSQLSPDALWFASLSTDGMSFTEHTEAGIARGELVAKGLKKLCKKAEIPYRSPHKLRHGHAMYAIMNAKDMGDLKALSQNLMHKNLTITDAVYGVLTENEIKKRIARLSGQASPAITSDDDQALITQLVTKVMQELRKEK